MKPAGEVRTQAHSNPVPAAERGVQRPRTVWSSLQWWPTLAGIGLAGFVALNMSRGSEIASVLAASGLVYVGAAALQRPSSAWPVFFVSFVVITAGRRGLTTVDATWPLLGLAALFVGYGLLRGATRPASGLPLQTIAMAACALLAAVAVIINGDLGAYLVAAGLLGHAIWDAHHHLANKVVARSLAEFCFVLDTLLALAILIALARS